MRHIDVIELEPKVIEANRFTAQLRKRNPLTDPRVNIIVNDARGALRLTDRRYDAIVSQPSHPWTAGASHLYTREFMQLAHDHLNSGGVFVQWMNVIFMDEDLLRSLTATLLKRVHRGARLSARSEHRRVPGQRRSRSMWSSSWRAAVCRCAMRRCTTRGSASTTSRTCVAALVLDSEGARRIAAGAPLITDDDNRIATSSVFEQRTRHDRRHQRPAVRRA